MPIVDLGLLGGRCRSVPRSTICGETTSKLRYCCRQQRCCRLRPERLSARRSVAPTVPFATLGHPCCPDLPSPPYRPKGARGGSRTGLPLGVMGDRGWL